MREPRDLEGRRDLITDPAVLQAALQSLHQLGVEFPIKVEGTSTLPYMAQVVSLEVDRGTFRLKLVRPLPHELASRAPFLMQFPWQDQRFETEIWYLERVEYLRYRFEVPKVLWLADRRRHPRFPFRPREGAYVVAQDARVPGRVLSGPLLNLSEGGALMRVDRVLRLDTGLRIPVFEAGFDRGVGLSRVRFQDLPRLPWLEVRGVVAHVEAVGSELHLGIDLGTLGEEEARALRECLAFRQALLTTRLRTGGDGPEGLPASGGGVPEERGAGAKAPDEGEPGGPSVELSVDPRRKLARRCVRVALVMGPGTRREHVLESLWDAGYARLEVHPDVASLEGALTTGAAPKLVVLDLQPFVEAGEEPLAVLRRLEAHEGCWANRAVAFVSSSPDPTLDWIEAPRFRFLDETKPSAWAMALDALAGFSAS